MSAVGVRTLCILLHVPNSTGVDDKADTQTVFIAWQVCL